MKKVILGLSGGVDSSASAIKLIEDGYEVEAIFMRNWDSATNNDVLGNPTVNDEICPQEIDFQDAKSVADKLGIKLTKVDFIDEYWDRVFSYFLKEYKEGRTPNPDVMCNKEIKFKAFLDLALKSGADYIAMGHYARTLHKDGHTYLLRGLDSNKDQSYFLAYLSEKQIEKVIFPVGDMNKSEVRSLASKYGLSTASKKDSTGICFIGERHFKEFLHNYLPAVPGKMVNYDDGKIIGDHDGLMYYTIGQSKGLGIGGLKEYENDKWFVVGKDLDTNTLLIAQGTNHPYLYSNKAIITDLNWINDKPIENRIYQAKFRYRAKDENVTITYLSDDSIMVNYPQKARAVTPGQFMVLYDDEVCLGGGVISKCYLDDELRKY